MPDDISAAAQTFQNWLSADQGSGIQVNTANLTCQTQEAFPSSSVDEIAKFAAALLRRPDVDQQTKRAICAALLPRLVQMAGNDKKQLRKVLQLADRLLQKRDLLTTPQRIKVAAQVLQQQNVQTVVGAARAKRSWLPWSRSNLDKRLIGKIQNLTFRAPVEVNSEAARMRLASLRVGEYVIYPDADGENFRVLVRLPGIAVDDIKAWTISAGDLRSPARFRLEEHWKELLQHNDFSVRSERNGSTIQPGKFEVVTRTINGVEQPASLRYFSTSGEVIEKPLSMPIFESLYQQYQAVDREMLSKWLKNAEQPNSLVIPRKPSTQPVPNVVLTASPPSGRSQRGIERWELFQAGYGVATTDWKPNAIPDLIAEQLESKDFVISVDHLERVTVHYKPTPDAQPVSQQLDDNFSYFEQIQRLLNR